MSRAALEEDAYEAELIDEFDAPTLSQEHVPPRCPPLQQQQQPAVSAQSLRHSTSSPSGAVSYPTLPSQTSDSRAIQHATSTGSFRALYPPFVGSNSASGYGASSTYGTARVAERIATTNQPLANRYPSISEQYTKVENNTHEPCEAAASVGMSSGSGGEIELPNRTPSREDSPCEVRAHMLPREDIIQPEAEELPVLSQEELEAKQQEIEKELAGYQHQLDYVAHALAGDTPHQKEERKRRELERQEREHQRWISMENRIQNQIDRAHERDERRAKILSRANRASRSPSPQSREQRGENLEKHEEVGRDRDEQ